MSSGVSHPSSRHGASGTLIPDSSPAPLGLILLVALLVFVNALPARFVWEDKDLVVENRFIRSFSSARFFFAPPYWRESHVAPGMAYKPVTMGSYVLDFMVWGLDPWGYHLTNLLIHCANALLLVTVLRPLLPSRSAALAAALLFAAHPIHTEAVDWVKNRADLLSTAFVLVAFLLFVQCWPPSGRKASGRGWRHVAALVAFAFALASKGTSLVLCPILVLYFLLFLPRREWRRALIATLPFWALAAAYMAFLWLGIKSHVVLVSEGQPPSAWRAALTYVQLNVLPTRLSADADVPSMLTCGPAALAGLALLIATACLLPQAAQRRTVLFSVAWALLALVPAAHVAAIASRPLAEQRLYLSSAGVCAFLALASSRMGRRGGVLRAALVVFFAAGAIQRHFAWRDDETLWRDTVIKSPLLARAHAMLADTYITRGLLNRALAASRQAVALKPHYARGQNTLGHALALKGDLDAAASAFQRALEANPTYAAAHNNLGGVLAQKGDLESAISEWQAAVKIDPGHIRAHQNLGMAFEKRGRLEEAIAEYRQAIGLSPANDAALFCALARLMRRLGRPDEAAAYYRQSLAAVPGYAPALAGLAELTSTRHAPRR